MMETFAFYQKKDSSMKEADIRNMFQEASKCVCIATVVVSLHPMFPTPSMSSARKTPENKEKDPEP
jgi:hypothetical protein